MRVAVLSDIHSNLVALDAVLAHAGTVDAVWQLGDVVGYGPDPDGVVARLVEVGAVGVRGNHDAAALGGREIEWFNPEARAAAEWTRDTIDAYDARLALSPAGAPHDRPGQSGPREPARSRSGSTSRTPLWRSRTWRSSTPTSASTAIPTCRSRSASCLTSGCGSSNRRAGTVSTLRGMPSLVNPGSVGQPRDGDPDASYLVLDPDTATVTWHRVAYDIAAVQAAIRAAGLPGRLADRLAFGA